MRAIVLFVLTCLSTTIIRGPEYSIALMSILLAHEFGHYLQCRRYGVPATLPLFIPMPIPPIGTMGAVIFQRGMQADRRQLFDIAISGPLAGLVVALPLLIWGLNHSTVTPIPIGRDEFELGEPLLVQWLIRWKYGVLLPGEAVKFSNVAFAGWVGVFITALNLIPFGQLDGGHLLYCLLGRPARRVALGLWFAALSIVVVGGTHFDPPLYHWGIMLFLVWLIGIQHPPTANDHVPLGPVRRILGWLTLAFVFIGFTANPIQINDGTPRERLVARPVAPKQVRVELPPQPLSWPSPAS